MSENENKNNTGVSEERMIYLKLFNKIMRWEHENKHTKRLSDKQMQDRVKKEIQVSVNCE